MKVKIYQLIEVVIDVDQANTEETLKQKLIAMGWTPPFGYRDES